MEISTSDIVIHFMISFEISQLHDDAPNIPENFLEISRVISDKMIDVRDQK